MSRLDTSVTTAEAEPERSRSYLSMVTTNADATPWRAFPWVRAAGLVVLLAALPFVVPAVMGGRTFLVQIIISFFMFACIAQCWNLVLAVSGIFSLAEIAFYAIGGYAAALVAINLGVSPWVAIAFGPVAAVIAALIVGAAVLRLRGIYVALLTLAVIELVRNFALTGPGWMGGGFGLRVDQLFTGPDAVRWFYFVGMTIFLVTTFGVWKVRHSPIGLAFMALRDSEVYGASRGINRVRLDMFVFAYSAFFLGLAGAFTAFWQGSMNPSALSFNVLIFVVMMIVIGGWGTFAGPIVGAGLLLFVDEIWLKTIDAGYANLVLGIFLLVFVVAMPRGLVPVFRSGVRRMTDWYASFE